MLARTAQAAYILGLVVRHNAQRNITDEEFHRNEHWQLDRTLRALLNLTHCEGHFKIMTICAMTGICNRYACCLTLALSDRH